MDSHGRIFYIDHKNHTTTWQKPSTIASSVAGISGEVTANVATGQHEQQLRQLDQRYQRVHRTIASASVSSEADIEGMSYAEGSSFVTAERQRELLIQVRSLRVDSEG